MLGQCRVEAGLIKVKVRNGLFVLGVIQGHMSYFLLLKYLNTPHPFLFQSCFKQAPANMTVDASMTIAMPMLINVCFIVTVKCQVSSVQRQVSSVTC